MFDYSFIHIYIFAVFYRNYFLTRKGLYRSRTLGERDAHSIVSSWAEKKRNRKLTPPQMDLLLSTFRKCPTPLFLKVNARSSGKVQQ
ncbi:hypothetical protein DPMN_106120 [Dreissena polymorpha]|uniref:Uncharacterized protein n=1 Tax=Dreissena polymorpha TaxID=45954 RepID=A0A9D4K4I7_DREPO|nr:hypothetical protein DPMN_106120 [Dreissena polymorpha]